MSMELLLVGVGQPDGPRRRCRHWGCLYPATPASLADRPTVRPPDRPTDPPTDPGPGLTPPPGVRPSRERLAAGHAELLTGDVAGLLRGQEHVGGSELRRLSGTSHGRLLAESSHRPLRHGGRDQ